MATFIGDSGDNSFTGPKDENNGYLLFDGGEDTVQGGLLSDSVIMGGALDRGDRLNGGGGDGDLVVLTGDYSAGLVISKAMMTNFEILGLDTGGDYNLSFADGVVKAGVTFQVDSTQQQADESITFDGSRETDGRFLFFLGASHSDVTGGAGDDTFAFFGAMADDDHLDGGKGVDVVDFINTGFDHLFGSSELRNIEVLLADAHADFHWTMNDANVAAGRTMNIGAFNATSILLDATAETDGVYSVIGSTGADTVIGGLGADTFQGGAGDDVLIGRDGADILEGDGGADSFVYRSLEDSTRKHADLITDLSAGDSIDLSNIDARADKAGNQAFHQVAAFTGSAGELILKFNAETGQTTLAGDVDGDGRADIAILLNGDHTGFTGLVL